MANSELYDQLRQLFEGIRDERRTHANTAERIGNAFLSLLSYAGMGGGGTGGDGGSTSGDCCSLKKEIPVGVTVGMLNKGAKLNIGMTCEEIFRRMLYNVDPGTVTASLSHGNDVEFGTAKGTITYTAAQNASGPLEKAETEAGTDVLANFQGGKWVRDLKTTSTDGDKYIKEDKYTFTLGWKFSKNADFPTGTAGTSTISVKVRRKWFAGVVTEAPANSADVRALTSGGLYTGSGKYNFQAAKGWHMIAVCLPGDVTVKNMETEKKDGNYTDSSDWRRAGSVDVEGANGSKATAYSVYTFGPTPADNDGFTFTFEV